MKPTMPKMELTYAPELRLCKVGDELGYFHAWEQTSSVLEPSMLRGGHPGGTVVQMYALVEFADGVKRVQPYEVKFVDEQNDILKMLNQKFDTNSDPDVIEKWNKSLIEIWQKYFPPNQKKH